MKCSRLVLVGFCAGLSAASLGALAPEKKSSLSDIPVVQPGMAASDVTGSSAKPPGDAIALFDGKSAAGWVQPDGKPANWRVQDGLLIAGASDVNSKLQFGDAQIHLEFMIPPNPKGHGNSGLYIHQRYEVQVLDSHSPNPFLASQQCAALYKERPPLVNACRPPGQWQSYDILFRAARLDDQGNVVKGARFTVFHNGVMVHHGVTLMEGTGAGKKRPPTARGPLRLQSHGSAVRYRNIWIRPLDGGR